MDIGNLTLMLHIPVYMTPPSPLTVYFMHLMLNIILEIEKDDS